MNRISGIFILINQLVLIAMPVFYFAFGDEYGLENTIFLFGSFIVIFVVSMVGVFKKSFDEMSSNISGDVNDLRLALGEIDTARPIAEEKFYETFLDKVKKANSIVYMAHLGIDPPSRVMENAKSYYRHIWEILKRKKNVEIKRVELYSDEKKDWLRDIVSKMSGKQGFFLWVIDGRENPKRFEGCLSVQIVDDEVFLVALASHHDRVRERDIMLRGNVFKSLWVDYYNGKLLSHARALIHNGVLNYDFYTELTGEGG